MSDTPTPDAPAPLLVTAPVAARMLSCCTKTLWALRRDGRLRAVHIGKGNGGIRFDVRDLDAFIEASKEGPPEART